MVSGVLESMNEASYDRTFMQRALAEAQIAYKADEVPIGAIVVSAEGTIVGSGYNQTEGLSSQSRHAEVVAIERSGIAQNDWRLTGCTLYVTIQPCLMCLGLVCLSRISRVVYGAESPLFGYTLDKELLPPVYSKHLKGISSGVLGLEAQQLIEEFFKKKRKQGEEFTEY